MAQERTEPKRVVVTCNRGNNFSGSTSMLIAELLKEAAEERNLSGQFKFECLPLDSERFHASLLDAHAVVSYDTFRVEVENALKKAGNARAVFLPFKLEYWTAPELKKKRAAEMLDRIRSAVGG